MPTYVVAANDFKDTHVDLSKTYVIITTYFIIK